MEKKRYWAQRRSDATIRLIEAGLRFQKLLRKIAQHTKQSTHRNLPVTAPWCAPAACNSPSSADTRWCTSHRPYRRPAQTVHRHSSAKTVNSNSTQNTPCNTRALLYLIANCLFLHSGSLMSPSRIFVNVTYLPGFMIVGCMSWDYLASVWVVEIKVCCPPRGKWEWESGWAIFFGVPWEPCIVRHRRNFSSVTNNRSTCRSSQGNFLTKYEAICAPPRWVGFMHNMGNAGGMIWSYLCFSVKKNGFHGPWMHLNCYLHTLALGFSSSDDTLSPVRAVPPLAGSWKQEIKHNFTWLELWEKNTK